MAVGDAGKVVMSTDGIVWNSEASGVKARLHGVIWGGNQFVVVGDSGIVLTSPEDPPNAILPFSPSADVFSLRFTSTRLLFTRPYSSMNQSAWAWIYAIQGGRKVEIHMGRNQRDLSLPIGNLSQGKYLFVFKTPDALISRGFIK